jgi:RNA polymerase sigma factor (sigma-70 family)
MDTTTRSPAPLRTDPESPATGLEPTTDNQRMRYGGTHGDDVRPAADLVHAARGGQQGAWTELTRRYTNLLWSIARGMRLDQADAADAVATTWLRLVEHLDTLQEPEHVGAWLATTVRRECLAVRRRGQRVAPVAPEDLPESAHRAGAIGAGGAVGVGHPTGMDPPDAALLTAERDAALWQAFRTLGAGCQRLLRVLIADPAPSYAEVAAALDMPVGSIGPTRARCLRRLRARFVEPRTAGTTGG